MLLSTIICLPNSVRLLLFLTILAIIHCLCATTSEALTTVIPLKRYYSEKKSSVIRRFGTSTINSEQSQQSLRRRNIITVTAKAIINYPAFISSGLLIIPSSTSYASETIGKDPNCNDASCLGVWDGLLADCPHNNNNNNNVQLIGSGTGGGAGCTSSQDDTPGIFAEPWDYSEISYLDWQDEMKKLITTIQLVSAARKDKVTIQFQEGRYLRVLFTDVKSGETSMGEFYYTPNDTTVQFRIGSTTNQSSSPLFILSSLRNKERAELIRKRLGYLKLPVLRNRKRTLFFGESDLDTFGPGSAALGPPAEMTTGELEGRILE